MLYVLFLSLKYTHTKINENSRKNEIGDVLNFQERKLNFLKLHVNTHQHKYKKRHQ